MTAASDYAVKTFDKQQRFTRNIKQKFKSFNAPFAKCKLYTADRITAKRDLFDLRHIKNNTNLASVAQLVERGIRNALPYL